MSSSSVDRCPLCDGPVWGHVRNIATAPLVDFWNQYDYDLTIDFADLPDLLEQRRCCRCGLHFFSPRIIGPAQMYAKHASGTDDQAPSKWEFNEALNILNNYRPTKLLEFGCGKGNFLSQAQRSFGDATGVDFNPSAIELCRSRGLNVVDGPLGEIDETFDAIVSFQAVEHLEKPAAFIESALFLLRPGGILLIAVPNQDGVLRDIAMNYLNLPPHHATLWERSCFDYIAEKYGLEFIKYSKEPISLKVYQAYLFPRLSERPRNQGIVSRLINSSEGALFHIISGIAFDFIRDKIDGHTHMAAFKKIS